MPSLGADMESGTLIEWLKKPGDKIARGDIVAVVETQKGAIEIEIFEDGIFTKFLVQPGTKVAVGTPLAELAGGDEKLSGMVAKPPVVEPRTARPPSPPPPLPSPPPSSIPRPTQPPTATHDNVATSPAARKLAADHGVDLGTIQGTGPGGAIVFVDVENALKAPAGGKPQAKRAAGPNVVEMRKAIAGAMSRAKREIPHYYLSHTANLGPAQKWLERTNAEREPAQRVLLGALLIKAVAKALNGMPDFNGFYVEETYRPSAAIHVGAAIAVRGGGLIAPAIHDADRLSVNEIMAKLRDLAARVRSGRLRGSELTDPTITISSLGDRGVEALYGIIHPPQVALVGFGTPQMRPWIADNAVVAATVMSATLAADHRVSDGHRGGLFLGAITAALESPEAL